VSIDRVSRPVRGIATSDTVRVGSIAAGGIVPARTGLPVGTGALVTSATFDRGLGDEVDIVDLHGDRHAPTTTGWDVSSRSLSEPLLVEGMPGSSRRSQQRSRLFLAPRLDNEALFYAHIMVQDGRDHDEAAYQESWITPTVLGEVSHAERGRERWASGSFTDGMITTQGSRPKEPICLDFSRDRRPVFPECPSRDPVWKSAVRCFRKTDRDVQPRRIDNHYDLSIMR